MQDRVTETYYLTSQNFSIFTFFTIMNYMPSIDLINYYFIYTYTLH